MIRLARQWFACRRLASDRAKRKPRDRSAKWFVALAIVIAAFFALQLLRWFV